MIDKFMNKIKNNHIFHYNYTSQFIVFFIILITIIYGFLHLNNYLGGVSEYALNELFINFQSGFIRRGLLGEIFLQVYNITNIEIRILFGYLFIILYLAQIFLFYKIFKKYFNSIYIVALIFLSPTFLLFNIYDPNVYFLKDIFIKLSILAHAYVILFYAIEKNNLEKYLFILKFFLIPLLSFVILIHEYQVLFLAIHYLFSLSIIKDKKSILIINKIYFVLLIPIIFVLIFIGDQSQYDNLNLFLSKFNVKLHPQLSGGFYSALGGFYKWHFYYFSYRDFINLFFSIFLSIIVFYLLFQYLIERKILSFNSSYQKNYLTYFLPTLVCFVLATDHGRNISLISLHLITFYSILKLDSKKFIFLKKSINKFFFLKFSLILFLIFYIFMWKLEQMAGFGLRGIPNDIFQSSLFAEFVKFLKFLYKFIDLNIINLPRI